MGYQPVYGININQLNGNEYGQTSYQLVKELVKQEIVNSSGNNTVDGLFTEQERCRKMDTDVFCHESFKRCYISSSPQLLCREICEDLEFNVCKREYKRMKEFTVQVHRSSSGYPYTFIMRNCKTLPFRNESPNCYYPDEIRGQYKG